MKTGCFVFFRTSPSSIVRDTFRGIVTGKDVAIMQCKKKYDGGALQDSETQVVLSEASGEVQPSAEKTFSRAAQRQISG